MSWLLSMFMLVFGAQESENQDSQTTAEAPVYAAQCDDCEDKISNGF